MLIFFTEDLRRGFIFFAGKKAVHNNIQDYIEAKIRGRVLVGQVSVRYGLIKFLRVVDTEVITDKNLYIIKIGNARDFRFTLFNIFSSAQNL